MPNHIANLITLRGDEKRIAEVREQLRYQEDGLGSLDFNKLIPMPKSLEIEEGSNTTNAIRLYVTAVDPNITWLNPNHKMAEKDFLELQKALDGKQPFPSYDALLARIPEEQIPSLLELGKQAVENQQQYGATTWYHWSIQNWGTKWNSYGGYGNRVCEKNQFLFFTAWSEPEPVIQKLSEQYPEIEFHHQWADEDYGYNLGEKTYRAGVVLDETWIEEGTAAAREFAAWLFDGEDTELSKVLDEDMDGMQQFS